MDLPSSNRNESTTDSDLENNSGQKADAPTWLFENIATLSHSARTIHVVYVGFLVYCAVTIFSTTDQQIMFGHEARLPLLNLDVPFPVFVLTAPAVAIFMFVYLQLHVQVLKRLTLELRKAHALPQDRLYPWMIHLAEEPEVGAMGTLQKIIVHFSLWWLLPVVLFQFALFTLRKHIPALSIAESLIFCAGMVLVFWLFNRYHNIPLEAADRRLQRLARLPWFENHPWQVVLGVVAASAGVFLLLMIKDSNKEMAKLFDVNLSGLVLSRSPQDGSKYGTNLRAFRLQRANLENTTLKSANLRYAQLQVANLQSANLEDADLSAADLQRADLSNAIFTNALMRSSILVDANLNCANLSGSHLEDADLSGAFLVRADLLGTHVTSAQLLKTRSLSEAVNVDKHIEDAINAIKPWLFDKPPLEDKEIESYQSASDNVKIGEWKKEENGKSFEIGKQLEYADENLEVVNFLKRLLVKDSYRVVALKGMGYAVAEVRYFQTKTKTKDEKFYLRTELVSRPMMVPCSVKDK